MIRLISTVSAFGLLAALPGPLAAQFFGGDRLLARMNEAGVEIERGLAAAESARLAGRCDARHSQLLRVKKIIEELEGYQRSGGLLGGTPERTNEARSRAQAILNAPCPPPADTPAQPPTVAVTPPAPQAAPAASEPGRTRTLEDLQIEYAAASCGSDAEKAEAKKNLLTALDRAIGMEKDEGRRERLLRQRQRVADDKVGQPKTCPPPATPTAPPQVGALPSTGAGAAPPGTGVDDFGKAVAGRMGVATEIEESFAVAERARLAGDCTLWANRLGGIEMLLGAFDTSPKLDEAQRPAFVQWRARLAAERAKPCPPTEWDAPPKVGAVPQTGSPLAAVGMVADARKAELRRRAALYFDVLFLSNFLPQAGIGVRRDGAPGAAPENFAGTTPRRVNGLGISAGFNGVKVGGDLDVDAWVKYLKGDAKTEFTSPASGTQRVDTGIVYGRLSNGSSGIIAGFGGTGSAKVDLEEWGVGGDVGWEFTPSSGIPYTVGLRALVGAEYTRAQRRYETSISSSGISGGTTFSFGQTRDQTLTEDYLDLSGGLEFEIPVTGTTDGGLTFGGRIKVGAYHRDTGLRSTERDTASFGPAGNRDLTIAIDGKDKGWGGRVQLGAKLDLKLSDALSIGAGLNYDYRSDVGSVINPNSGDQVFFQGQTTRIGITDWQAWDAAVGLKLRF